MKKEIALILALPILLFLFVIPFLQAIQISLSKENYEPGETLQAEITGNFISLNKDNIFIYKEDNLRAFSGISNLILQDKIYYYFIILSNQEGNFSLKIKNSYYLRAGELRSDEIVKNFTIKKTNQSLLSINPGFVLTDKDFTVKIKSLSGNQDITAFFDAENQTKTLSIKEDFEEKIVFSSFNLTGKYSLKINDYTIPVFLYQKINNTKGNTTENETDKTINRLEFIPKDIKGTVTSGENYSFKIFLKNSGEKNLTNITFSGSLVFSIRPEILDLNSNESKILNLTISVPKSEETVLGEIIAEFDGKTIELPIEFEITENKSEVKINVSITDGEIKKSLSCSLIGKKCLENEECDKDEVSSLEGSCCPGECIEKKSSSSTWIIGIILIIVILIIIFFFYKRTKKPGIKSTEEILKEKSKYFSERMNPQSEVSGGLGRV